MTGPKKQLGRALRLGLGALFPARCAACATYLDLDESMARELADTDVPETPRDYWLCAGCVRRLVPIDAGCPTCAEPRDDFLDVPDAIGPCRRCRAEPPPWSRAHAAFEYGGAALDAVHRLKFGKVHAVATALAALLANSVAGSDLTLAGDEVIVPLPLHVRRRAQRGFDQAGAIARGLAPRLGLDVADLLVRARETKPQTEMESVEARAHNVHDAFAIARDAVVPTGGRLLLLDDVMTTGSTALAAAHTLHEAGADVAAVIVFARART